MVINNILLHALIFSLYTGGECRAYIEMIKITGAPQNNDSTLIADILDKVQQADFPYRSAYYNRDKVPQSDLSVFKEKSLYGIPYKKIPVEIEGGRIDFDDNDSAFDLVSENYIAEWVLIAERPGYFVIELSSGGAKTVTVRWDMTVIDAINTSTSDPLSNANFRAYRYSVIDQDLTIQIFHEFEGKTTSDNDENPEWEKFASDEKWFIDENGYFQKKKSKENIKENTISQFTVNRSYLKTNFAR